MSLYNYFSKLGSISYNGDVVNNIITSIRFKRFVDENNVVFYPYVVEEGERPDQIAAHYYDDERYAWVVFLSNSIVDPYFEWHLTGDQFKAHIIKKYGSVEEALQTTAFYRNNWYNDDSMITPGAFEALPSNLKKYWNPIVGYTGTIGSYERKRLDTIVETNRVIELTVNTVTDVAIGQKVIQKTSGVTSGEGVVRAITTNSIIINNIVGSFSNTGGSVGSLTDNDASFSKTVSDVEIINTPIPESEASYWSPISFFDYENELNESRKTIRLLDKQYLTTVEDQMVELLA